MQSIRTKFIFLTVCEIIVVVIITGLLGIAAISNLANDDAKQILFLCCEDGKKELDTYFKGVEQSVETISDYADEDLNNTSLDSIGSHLKKIEEIFEKTARNTDGILTYYYRIDPSVSANAKGFWYVNLDGNGFEEHEVTDITLYDTNDQSNLVWFTVPKATGHSVWLPPYFTDNLGAYVISYNVPVYKGDMFVGVIGIEIDYNIIANHVNDIKLYDNGYAFINDTEGKIIYHPRMDISKFTGGNNPKVPEEMKTDNTFVRYTYDGIDKQAAQLPLHNGMRIFVTVPTPEINVTWKNLLKEIIFTSILLILVFAMFTMRMAGRITKPLQELTNAAMQVDAGIYDFELDYDKDDEVGILARTFNQLVGHLKVYIKELSDLAYSDSLTSVHNKCAFDIYINDLQSALDRSHARFEFAIGIFDCNDLKLINDRFGHEKGNIYLKSAVSIICRVFSHSLVFRVGGDEFAVILQNEDYRNRKRLARTFEDRIAKTALSKERWTQISVAMGIAVFNPKTDKNVVDVIRRADDLMYKNKRSQKEED